MTDQRPVTPAPAPLEAYAHQFDGRFAKLNQRNSFRRYKAESKAYLIPLNLEKCEKDEKIAQSFTIPHFLSARLRKNQYMVCLQITTTYLACCTSCNSCDITTTVQFLFIVFILLKPQPLSRSLASQTDGSASDLPIGMR